MGRLVMGTTQLELVVRRVGGTEQVTNVKHAAWEYDEDEPTRVRLADAAGYAPLHESIVMAAVREHIAELDATDAEKHRAYLQRQVAQHTREQDEARTALDTARAELDALEPAEVIA